MRCPTCDNVNLAMTDRQGIEIDYCPKCRGIWLDRGELDRLIERAEQASPPPVQHAPPQSPPPRYEQDAGYRGDRDGGRVHPQKEYRQKRPKSLLGELFDF